MRKEICVLRHRFLGRTTLELVVKRTSCRMGVVLFAGPEAFRFLEGVTVRTVAGWFKAAYSCGGGETWLNPWVALVRVAPGKYELLLEFVRHGP